MRISRILQILTFLFLTALFFNGCSQGAVPVSAQPRTETPGLLFLSSDDAERLREERTESNLPLPALCTVSPDGVYAEVVCAWNEKVPTYYLPVDPDGEDWSDVTLSADGCRFYLITPDGSVPDRKETLAAGTVFRVLFAGERYYAEAKLVFTGMPIVSIDLTSAGGTRKTSTEIGDEDSPMHFSYYDSCDPATGAPLSFACEGKVHIRGGTSRDYEKHSLKFSLQKEDGTGKNISLCGLREDDDWVLNAMYQEETKIRDMLAFDLWEKLGGYCLGDNAYCGTRMRYVEVLIGGKYWGLYGLCEPEDAKQFGLNGEDGGAVYKVGSWDVPSVREIRNTITRKSHWVAEIELKYPDTVTADAWRPFADYVDAAYEANDYYFENHIADSIDPDNMIDYWLFLNLICGYDNTWKNMYLAYVPSFGKLYMAPWDCDISFGLTWVAETYLHLEHSEDVFSDVLGLECEKRMLRLDACDAVALARKKFDALPSLGITAESLCARADEFFAYINDTGAMQRNRNRWRKSGYIKNIDYLKKAVAARFDVIENAICGYEQ